MADKNLFTFLGIRQPKISSINPKNYELRVSFLDQDGEELVTNVAIVQLVELLDRPFSWSFGSEKISGICLNLRKSSVGEQTGGIC